MILIRETHEQLLPKESTRSYRTARGSDRDKDATVLVAFSEC